MRKPLTHRIKHWMFRNRFTIVVVGCGGTGAALISGLPYLHHALLANGPSVRDQGLRDRRGQHHRNELSAPAVFEKRSGTLQGAGAGQPAERILGPGLVRNTNSCAIREGCPRL
jgi:hypothetical protein